MLREFNIALNPCLLYVGTGDGVLVYEVSNDPLELIGRGLEGNAIRGIAVHPDAPWTAYIACGHRGWGLYRTRDAGKSFEALGFGEQWVWDVVLQPGDPKHLWVGTEPPMLYVSHDEAQTFRPLEAIERLPSRPYWKFFHPPFYAGHIHGIAVHPQRPERIFAGVEHGAFIYSHDAGETWQEALIGHDLHRVAVDPDKPDRVLAGAGEGLFISEDAGKTWTAVAALKGKYVHAIVFDPQNSQRMYVYVAEEGSPLYRSDDGGKTWRGIGAGLPAARPADSLSHHPVDPQTLFYAGDVAEKQGQIFVSRDAGETWQPLSAVLPKVWRLRTARGRNGS